MKTGVFFHREFSLKDWPIIGNKYRNFPGVMEKALSLEGVKLFESKPAAEELLSQGSYGKLFKGCEEGLVLPRSYPCRWRLCGGFREDCRGGDHECPCLRCCGRSPCRTCIRLGWDVSFLCRACGGSCPGSHWPPAVCDPRYG